MKTIAVGALTMAFGAAMYPFWPETAVLGPFWSSAVMGGAGIITAALGILLVANNAR